MQIFDISVGVHPGLPVWPGDPAVELERVASIGDDSPANVSRLACGVHVGTHVDAPLHFVDGGGTVEELSLEVLVGEAYIAEIHAEGHLDRKALEQAGIPHKARRVLLKTSNSALWRSSPGQFVTGFVAVSESGAEWLVERGVQLVGVDYLSVAPFDAGVPTHVRLLSAGVIIIEGLDLSGIEAGWYSLTCLPLKLVGSEGAPARAILVRDPA
jgi:arylformamidase